MSEVLTDEDQSRTSWVLLAAASESALGMRAVDKLRRLLVHSRVDPEGGDSERTRGEDGVVVRTRQLERGVSAENVDVASSRPRGN